MKNPARWLIALALAACALAWWDRQPSEPIYQGRRLLLWLRAGSDAASKQEQLSPEQIRSFGPAAVKWLTYTAEHGQVPFREQGPLNQFYGHLRGLDLTSAGIPEHDDRLSAVVMLGQMRSAAKPAIPILLRTLNSSSNYTRITPSAVTLHRIGPDSWPVIEDQLANGSFFARCALIRTIWQRLDTENAQVSVDDANKVFTLLTRALHDLEPEIRRNAASSLGQAMPFAFYRNVSWSLVEQATAALWPLEDDSNRVIRSAKEAVLTYYRESKPESVSRLTPLLSDPEEAKRNFARAILDQLAKP